MEKSTCQTRGLIVCAVFAFNGQLQGKTQKKDWRFKCILSVRDQMAAGEGGQLKSTKCIDATHRQAMLSNLDTDFDIDKSSFPQ